MFAQACKKNNGLRKNRFFRGMYLLVTLDKSRAFKYYVVILRERHRELALAREKGDFESPKVTPKE